MRRRGELLAGVYVEDDELADVHPELIQWYYGVDGQPIYRNEANGAGQSDDGKS